MARTISYNHPRYNDIKREAATRFDRDFNEVSVDSAETVAHQCLFEYVQAPSFKVQADEWLNDSGDEEEVYTDYLSDRLPEPDGDDLVDDALADEKYGIVEDESACGTEWLLSKRSSTSLKSFILTSVHDSEDAAREALAEILLANWNKERTELIGKLVKEGPELLDSLEDVDEDDFYEWLDSSNYSDAVREHFEEREWYPMWSTLFEAKDRLLSQKILDNIDELYECGIGVISGLGDFGPMLFIAGAGYDFYEAHWIPLYVTFGWIKPSQYPAPDLKLTKCNHCGHDVFAYNVEMRVTPVLGENGKHELSTAVMHENHRTPRVLRCTNCCTEHAESNFVWAD